MAQDKTTSTSVEVNWIISDGLAADKIEYQPLYSHQDADDWETVPWKAIPEMKYNFTNLFPFTR